MASVTRRDMDENAKADDDRERREEEAREAAEAAAEEAAERDEIVDEEEDEDEAEEDEDHRRRHAARMAQRAAEQAEEQEAEKVGFFTIYKRGQGYWTRMGTAGGAALVGLLTAAFFYEYLPAWGVPSNVTLGVIGGFLVGFALLGFWVMNKPANADFLIATDSEMKKVNWTSRKDLVGSTKVVIIFMFAVAALLFVADVLFGYFFYFINVLKTKPF